MPSLNFTCQFIASTALMAFASTGYAQDSAINQLTQALKLSGGNGHSSYTLSPSWSENLGFSLNGHYGAMMGSSSAFGIGARVGENVTEGLVNLGFTFGQHYDVMISASRLHEKLSINGTASREWVGQNAFGATLKRDWFTANAYLTDSQSTDNYVGARSVGADFGAEQALSRIATLSSSIGYQSIKWDDGSVTKNGITGSLGLKVAAGENAMFNFVAAENLSENKYGIQSTWQLETGALNIGYTQIEGRNGSIADDRRVQFGYSVQLGNKTNDRPVVRNRGTQNQEAGVRLLSQAMQRPSYLPEGIITKAANIGNDTTSHCVFELYPDRVDLVYGDNGSMSVLLPGRPDYSFPTSVRVTNGSDAPEILTLSSDDWESATYSISIFNLNGMYSSGDAVTVQYVVREEQCEISTSIYYELT